MQRPQLYLLDKQGKVVAPAIQAAVEQAHRWAIRDFPSVDSAKIDDWAEEVAASMQDRSDSITSPNRYAYAALQGKVKDWLRTRAAKEEVVGIGPELERIGGLGGSFGEAVERKILFEQLKATLNPRDRYILVLLLEDKSSPAAVAEALGTTYSAAAKAIQRVKERIAEALNGARSSAAHRATRLCGTKG